MEQPTHTKRMLFVLALMLLALVAVSVAQLSGGEEQQAAVLRAYAE